MSSIGSVKRTSILKTILSGFEVIFSTGSVSKQEQLAAKVAEIERQQTPDVIEGLETNMRNIGNEKSTKEKEKSLAQKVNLTGRRNLDKGENHNPRKKEDKEKEI